MKLANSLDLLLSCSLIIKISLNSLGTVLHIVYLRIQKIRCLIHILARVCSEIPVTHSPLPGTFYAPNNHITNANYYMFLWIPTCRKTRVHHKLSIAWWWWRFGWWWWWWWWEIRWHVHAFYLLHFIYSIHTKMWMDITIWESTWETTTHHWLNLLWSSRRWWFHNATIPLYHFRKFGKQWYLKT